MSLKLKKITDYLSKRYGYQTLLTSTVYGNPLSVALVEYNSELN